MRAMPLLLAVSVPSPVFAATLTVGPGHAEYHSIEAAVADAEDGDEIRVLPGTYRESIVIDRHIVLRGTGPELTILAPTSAGPAITVTGGADARIEQVTVAAEQGIRVEDGSRLELAVATVRGARTTANGGGLAVVGGSSAWVETVRFVDNESEGSGGHVYVEGSDVEVVASSFRDGRARAGGAIAARDAVIRVSAVAFEANVAAEAGGAVVLDGGRLDLLDVELRGNAAAEGAGVAIRGERAQLGVMGATFEGHVVPGRGGAVAVSADTGQIALADVRFRGNQAEHGGAIAVAGTHEGLGVVVERSSFDGNLAGKGGGAVWVDGAAWLRLVGNAFTANASDRRGGALELADVAEAQSIANRFCGNASAWEGGAVHDRYAGHHAWFNNRFSGNTAGTAGGAVAVTFPRAGDLARGTGPTFVNNAFLHGEATSGSALWLTVWEGSSGRYVDFRNNLVAWNEGHGAVLGDPRGLDTVLAWNDFWRTGAPFVGMDETFATFDVDPRLADDGCTSSRLRADSPLVDAGDPALFDGDGTRSDVGPDGGPFATPEYVVVRDDGGVVVRTPTADEPEPPAPDEATGGCSTAPAAAAWTFLLLPLLARRRRAA